MPRFCAHLFLAALVVAVVIPAVSEQPHGDSDAATAETLQSIERAWLNAEKNHDAAAFEEFVADDWGAITPDGKSQTKAERAAEIKASRIASATMGRHEGPCLWRCCSGHRQRRRSQRGRREKVQLALRLDRRVCEAPGEVVGRGVADRGDKVVRAHLADLTHR